MKKFARRGYALHIVIDDQIPHVQRVSNPDELRQLRFDHQDYPLYYYCVFGDLSGDHENMGGRGRALIGEGTLAVWAGRRKWLPRIFMHELGHLIRGRRSDNPRMEHTLDHPKRWSDGSHCPHNCAMNYFQKMGLWAKAKQAFAFDYCRLCWEAVLPFRPD